jgi:hypothetical protein
MNRLPVLFISAFLFLPAALNAFDLWRRPEIADAHAVFADVGIPFMFDNFEINLLPINIRVDYMPPLPLPLSVGVFFDTPYQNLKSFGIRVGYHIDTRSPRTDIYLLYSFNTGFILTGVLDHYNDTPAPTHFFDFRAGFRYFFTSWLGLSVETGFKLQSVVVSFSIKIN